MPAIGLNPSHDTYVNSEKPTTALGASGASAFRQIVGSDVNLADGTLSPGFCLSWQMYDLSGIPVDKIITNAYLISNFYYVASNYSDLEVVIARATDIAWTETTLTFLNAPNLSVGSIESSVTVPPEFNYIGIFYNLAAAVQAALAARKVSFRLAINSGLEDGHGAYMQDYDYNSPAPETRYPYLVVEYTDPPTFSPKIININ